MMARSFVGLLFAFLTAEAYASGVQEASRVVPPTDPPMPFNAIEIGDDVFMVPVTQDRYGCALYSMQTSGRAVLEVYFYQTSTGDFTTDRRQASC